MSSDVSNTDISNAVAPPFGTSDKDHLRIKRRRNSTGIISLRNKNLIRDAV